MKWKDMDAQERYQIVELARSGKSPITELCQSFGVSRQTLYRAMETAERAAQAALEPKKRGRKPSPPAQREMEQLRRERQLLEKQLSRWKTKYEVAYSMLQIERQLDRAEPLPGEKKPLARSTRERKRTSRKKRSGSTNSARSGRKTQVAAGRDGESDGHLDQGSQALRNKPAQGDGDASPERSS